MTPRHPILDLTSLFLYLHIYTISLLFMLTLTVEQMDLARIRGTQCNMTLPLCRYNHAAMHTDTEREAEGSSKNIRYSIHRHSTSSSINDHTTMHADTKREADGFSKNEVLDVTSLYLYLYIRPLYCVCVYADSEHKADESSKNMRYST